MAKRTIELESLKLLLEENEKLKGTKEWHKYHMYYETKIDGKWVFIGWGVPNRLQENYIEESYLKSYKDNTYIYIQYLNGPDRWCITDNVKELLNLE